MIFMVLAIVGIVGFYIFYCIEYRYAMERAADMLDSTFEKKFENAGIVVKKDDRIIECNGMMIPMQCGKCRFGRVNEGDVECFVPEYDGVPTIGLKR